ncbi:phospholipase A2-like [Ischnura elegans]|uniref:phospholipase A2-like n=1 Tax=Ischnura elegans TaxID=197161 RepID=UPI001ED88E4E|nr:phospholipase A2-like [Ischnura elegans]
MAGVVALVSRALLASLVLLACASALDPSARVVGARRNARMASLAASGMVFPGTRYCGRVDNPNAFVYYSAVDQCCKALKDCPGAVIMPGQTDAITQITNTCPILPLRDCKCDDAFLKCLQNVRSLAAVAVGSIYFDGFSRKCYTEDFPLKCRSQQQIQKCPFCFGGYCTDTTAPKVWHTRPDNYFLSRPATAAIQPPAC